MEYGFLPQQAAPDASPVKSATDDLRRALPRAMRLTWDFGMAPRGTAVHMLTVEQGSLSLLFQIDRQTLSNRDADYALFIRSVIEAVAKNFSPGSAAVQ